MALPEVTFLLGESVLRPGRAATQPCASTEHGGHLWDSRDTSPVNLQTSEMWKAKGGAAAGAEPQTLLARSPRVAAGVCKGFHSQQVPRDQR